MPLTEVPPASEPSVPAPADDAVARAMARLEAREDPPPPPELPPLEVKTLLDLRLRVDLIVETGKPNQKRWTVTDSGGAEMHPQEVARLMVACADFVANTPGNNWAQPIYQAACRMMGKVVEAAQSAERLRRAQPAS